MKDAFGKKIGIGDSVVYSSYNHYVIGEIVKLYRSKPTTPDRVGVQVTEVSKNSTIDLSEIDRTSIVNASNVVKR